MPSRLPRWLLSCLLLMLIAGCSSAPRAPSHGHFEARAVKVDGRTAHYQVFIPATATAAAGPLPVVLFLHGSGERGRDGVKQTHAGLGPYLRANPQFPALVVLPQVPNDEEWSGANNRVALAALDATLAEFGADPARQYLTGMSMGGYGTWNIALAHPQRFAALVPVCGALRSPRASAALRRARAGLWRPALAARRTPRAGGGGGSQPRRSVCRRGRTAHPHPGMDVPWRAGRRGAAGG